MAQGDPQRDPLRQPIAAIDRIDQLVTDMRRDFAAAEARAERRMQQVERSEKAFIAAIGAIRANIQRSTERLDEAGEGLRAVRDSIRADTESVYAMLDRLGPARG